MKQIAWVVFIMLTLLSMTHAASFDCAKAATMVEKLICGDAELSKLDEELNAAYKTALQDEKHADSTKQAQKRWMKERNVCAEASCVRNAYLKRNEQLRVPGSTSGQAARTVTTEKLKTNSVEVQGGGNPDQSAFKGEYILVRGVSKYLLVQGKPVESICKPFKDNLNRFRKLDFDQCNPRLSDKFPEFSRPYQWKEIPFDMALAEKAIRSTTDYSNYGSSEYPEDAEEHRKEGEDRWQQWKKGSETFRVVGNAHMWLTKIDIDGDGKEDTILRMIPSGRYSIDPKRPSRWSCDYNIGELYVIESGNPHMAALFNLHADLASDIILYAKDNHYYLVEWMAGTSTTSSWFNQELPDIGGTRGVVIRDLHMDSPDSYAMPATMCLIDWVPTGHFNSASKVQP